MGRTSQYGRLKLKQSISQRCFSQFGNFLILVSFGLALPAVILPIAQAQNQDALTDLNTLQLETSQDVGNQVFATARAAQNEQSRAGGGDKYFFALPKALEYDYLWFQFQLPMTYDSNATLAAHDAIVSDRFDPKLQVNFSQKFDSLNLLLTDITAYDADRYIRAPSSATETFQSIVQLNYVHNGFVDPKSKQKSETTCEAIPYLWYQPTLKYNNTHEKSPLEQNDVGGGISYKLKLSESPCSGSTMPTSPDDSWLMSLDANFTERYTEPTNSSSLWLKATVTRTFGAPHIVLQFAPNFRFRWFESVDAFARHDDTLVMPLFLEWDPSPRATNKSWFPDIQLSLYYAKNFSNGPKFQYQQWNNGPVPELSYLDYGFENKL